jgi:glutamyl-Q tRNA(Asp) synthetase
MEDVDQPRCHPATGQAILTTLARFGLHSDEPVVWQSQRIAHYQAALHRLIAANLAYPCACTRRTLAHTRCTCRAATPPGRPQRSWRFRSPNSTDDAILLRADGFFSYQLAVVVDDHLQNVTHVVRGEDLLETTPGQLALQQALGYPSPAYRHIPIVRDAHGDKLSKQTRAPAIDGTPPELALSRALIHLGLPPRNIASDWPSWAVPAWQSLRR